MPSRKPNSFMMYVQEWRQNNSKGKDMPISQAVNLCGVMWQKMTKLERRPYEDKAKSNYRVSQIELAQREAKERLEEIERRIETIVREGMEADGLENAKFVLVNFNSFTQTLRGRMYMPAEFSACQFSLKQGIISDYSTLINPGMLDIGQCHDAKHHSSTTHNLPLPPNALGERDLQRTFTKIVNFVTNCCGCKPLVAFTLTDRVSEVESCFSYLAEASMQKTFGIEIFSLEDLLFLLTRKALQDPGLSKCVTDSVIRKDPFEFSRYISCEYHENIDNTRYCSQSMVRRWAYSVCDYLCGDLKIAIKSGKHIPPRGNSSDNSCAEYPCLAGFGRGRGRGRMPTLGEARP